MRNFLGALAFATGFFFAQHASALIITAKLDAFQSVPQTIQGVGTGGGRGTFSLIGSDAPIAGDLAEILDASFQAVCLEPDSFITTGQTYNFAVVDLAFAPTNGVPGGMGAVREGLVEKALGRQSVTTMEDLSVAGVAAVTALVYEAGYESAVNGLDLTAGTAIVTGSGAPAAQASLSGNPLTEVNAWALINLGPAGRRTRTVFEGQDFMVTVGSPVAAPGVMALFGIGLLGMARVFKS